MEAYSRGDDHDGGQKGRMDSTLIAIKGRLLGGRGSNGTSATEPPSSGGTETGSGSPEIQGAFRSLTPEMSMRTELESVQGSATPQLENIQERVAALGQYSIYTDGGWEYGGDGMDAPFYPYTDSPGHKGGGSVVFITTDLQRLQSRQGLNAAPSYVAIRIEQGEEVGRGPNPQELLALLVALGCESKLGRPREYNEEISSDCKSVVDYVNNHRQTRLRNEVGSLWP